MNEFKKNDSELPTLKQIYEAPRIFILLDASEVEGGAFQVPEGAGGGGQLSGEDS